MPCGFPCNEANGSSSAASAYFRSNPASAASDATRAPARKFEFRRAERSVSNPVKTCRTSVKRLYPTLEPYRKFQDRLWLHWALFAATLVSTTLWGASHYAAYLSDFKSAAAVTLPSRPVLLLGGLWYSATILLILGAHEMGHYLACRYYQVDATRPF